MDDKRYAGIIRHWLEYIRLEEFNNVQLKPGRSNTFTLPMSALQGDILTLEAGVFTEVKNALLVDYRGKSLPEKELSRNFPDDIFLLFPLLECKVDGGGRLCLPIGAINISQQLSSCYCDEGACLDLKDSIASFGCMSTVLSKACSYEDYEIDAIRLADGLFAFTEDLAGKVPSDIGNAIELVSAAVSRKSVGKYQVSRDVAIARLALADYSLRMQADLRELASSQRPDDKSLAMKYLTAQSQSNHTPAASTCKPYWLGQFHQTHLLGKGQAETMSQIAGGQDLIAVQGPPGTGKTTLILNVISNQIVMRAAAMIMEGKDIWSTANLTLVVSDTSKAVENVVAGIKERFTGSPFVVFEGGSQARIRGELPRIEEAIRWLTEMEYESERHHLVRNEIIKRVIALENDHSTFVHQCEELGQLQLQIEEHTRTIEGITEQILAKKQEVEGIRLGRFSEEDARSVSIAIAEIFAADNASTLLRQIFGRASGVTRQKIKDLKTTYGSKIFALTGVVVAPENLAMIQNIVNEWRLAYTEKQRLLADIDDLDRRQTVVVREKEALYDTFLSRAATLGSGKDYLQIFRSSKSNADTNSTLFELSVEYLRHEALKNRDASIEALECLRSVALGDRESRQSAHRLYTGARPLHCTLSLLYPVIASTLNSTRNLFPCTAYHPIDLVIADEAGMIQCHKLYPVLVRSRRAMVVGDPRQLPAVMTLALHQRLAFQRLWTEAGFTLEEFRNFSPTETTAFHRAAGTHRGAAHEEGTSQLLEEHRRCAQEIAETFMQVGGYSRLTVLTERSSELGTRLLDNYKTRLLAFNCTTPAQEIENLEEADTICRFLKRLQADRYDLTSDVAVITPFRRQESVLVNKLVVQENLLTTRQIGTVHKFQGQEFPVVIFSPAVTRFSQKSLSFVGDPPNLLNVAISRAKHLFIVAGNIYLMEQFGKSLGALAGKIRDKGIILDAGSDSAKTAAWPEAICTVRGLGHLMFLDYAFRIATQEIFISCAGLHGLIAERILSTLRAQTARGLKVWLFVNYSRTTRDLCLVDEELVGKYRELLGNRLVLLANDLPVHEQGVIVDGKTMTVGNFNWLHHCDSYLADYQMFLHHYRHRLNFAENFVALNSSFEKALSSDSARAMLVSSMVGIRREQSFYITDRGAIAKRREHLIEIASRNEL